MKLSTLKKDTSFESRNDKSYGIQTYGENNNYPQQARLVVGASGTGSSCLNIYKKFIAGKGLDEAFYSKIINNQGNTADYLLDRIKNDYAEFGGFAIHVNYNMNYKISEIQHIPFEHVRFEKLDEEGNFNRVALHWDWGRQFTALRRWKKDDIDFIDLFNPNEVAEQIEQAGGIANYKGQVYYYSSSGYKSYPLPIYDSVLTDMSTEEGLSNVSYRNVRHNFFPSGILVEKVQDNKSLGYKENTSDDITDTEKSLKEFQGDENAGKLMYVRIEVDEEEPKFISIPIQNFDKDFSVTINTTEEKIGRIFNQPPILRAKDVGANFGAELMRNAYNFYNSVTENERLTLERVFTEIFKYWHEEISLSFAITPLSYDVEVTPAEKIGKDGMMQVVNILNNNTLNLAQKKEIISIFYLTDIELSKIV